MYKIKRTNKKTGSIRHIRMEEDWRKTFKRSADRSITVLSADIYCPKNKKRQG